jgi:iron(III) transport system substrate-binding protein
METIVRSLRRAAAACGMALALAVASASYADAQEILFYSSVPRNLTDKLTKDFEARNPRIKVKTFQAGTETLLEKVELELKGSGRPVADVLWVQERSAMERYADQGLFAKYVPAGSEAIDPAFKDKDGRWIGNFVSFVVLLYNKPAFEGKELPTSWRDLADPKYRNKTMFADPRVSGTGMTVVSEFVQNFGREFLKEIAANRPLIANGHPAMISTVIAGERTLCPMQDISIYSATSRKQPVGFVFPREGAVAVPAFAAISAATTKMEAAKKFIDYLVSIDAANLLRANGMYHTRADAKPPEGWPAISSIKTMPFDWARHKSEKGEIKNLFSELTER